MSGEWNVKVNRQISSRMAQSSRIFSVLFLRIRGSCTSISCDSAGSSSDWGSQITSKRKWHHQAAGPSRRLVNYLMSLRWTPIPIGVGLALVGYQQYRRIQYREHEKLHDTESNVLATDLEVKLYRLVPLRTLSRAWGWVNNLYLPLWVRKPLLGMYVRTFGCNIEEAETEDLASYRNLGEFFRRPLKPSARCVNPDACLVSPADGTVMHFGQVKRCCLEQVKGITYTLNKFFGNITWLTTPVSKGISGTEYQESLLLDPKNNELFHYVVYLAPGDYHHFHSPADWEVVFRRHFTGDLLSVNPGIAKWIAGLFTLNERAMYVGRWKHGFFSLTAVGATNVGCIRVNIDEDLHTNVKKTRKGMQRDTFLTSGQAKANGIAITKGAEFGQFNLGSTIVLVFEAPRDFSFKVEVGKRVKVGEEVGKRTKPDAG